MVIFKHAAALSQYLKTVAGTIGFVPTMGALHAGHRSLVETSVADGNFTVASIFVNPTQFTEAADFEKYPVTTAADMQLLTNAGCNALYLPAVEDVYPAGSATAQTYDFGVLETVFEGAQRPGHFAGVGQVVARLLQIVQPGYLYLGQKDFQQCRVIADLIKQLQMEVELKTCPTLREADGLAMSSRNRRLSDAERVRAGTVYQCLISIKTKRGTVPFAILERESRELLTRKGFTVEYLSLADAETLQPMADFTAGRQVVLFAGRLGSTRLIDNMVLE
jgi:pantoate--beta-alanine ligase